MDRFGERLKRLREAKGLGANELDRLIGKKTGGYTSRMESGERGQPTLENARRLAEALGVPVSALTGAPTDDAPRVARPTRAEPDPTGLGRWRSYAARYAGFRATATFRQREEEIPDHILDAASDDLGLQKSEAGPTEEESNIAIDRWLARRKPKPDGRPAPAEAFGRPEPVKPPPSRPRAKARRGS